MKKGKDLFPIEFSEKLMKMEKNLGEIFKDMLFTYNLKESSAATLNEMELLDLTGNLLWKQTKPDFLSIALFQKNRKRLVNVYKNSRNFRIKEFVENPYFKKLLNNIYKKGKVEIKTEKIGTKNFPFLFIPLKAENKKMGITTFSKSPLTKYEIHSVISYCTICTGNLHNLKLYQQLLKNERLVAVGQTISGLSHDIKNILNGLEGGITLSKSFTKERNWEELKFSLSMVERSSRRLKNLVLDMVDFSKKRPLFYQEKDLNQLMERLIEDIKLAIGKNIIIEKKLDEKLPLVSIDYYKIDRVITNLLNNAADAIGNKNGKITVTTKFVSKNTVQIKISDNGCGIPKETLKRIFEIFYSTKGQRGTGLGLALAKKIIEDHHGEIKVNSETGKGTTFTLILPIKSPNVTS